MNFNDTKSTIRLCTVISIESDILRSLDFSQVVEKFAAMKSRNYNIIKIII